MDEDIIIERLTNTQVPSIAELHIEGITTGFISSLGDDFVSYLYQAIAQDKRSFYLVAVEDRKTIGFVTFTENLRKLLKTAVKNNGFKLALAIRSRMLRPSICMRIIQNIFYLNKTEKLNLPKVGLLSIITEHFY